jgi:ubiquitin-protein ligase
MTISHKDYYSAYKKGVQYRRKWEAGHLSILETSFKILEQCRTSKYEEMASAINTIAGYKAHYLKPVVELTEEQSAELFEGLRSKYEFELEGMDTRVSHVQFTSRAIISTADPATNSYYEADLGIFKTTIRFNNNLADQPTASGFYQAISQPIRENNPREIDGLSCFHPHINSSGTLCLGSYGARNGPANDDQKQFNIMGTFYNLCQLLCTYNANSLNFGGAYINNWVGHKCGICFEFAPEAVKCEKTGKMIHKDCAEEVDGKFYGLDQVKKCTKCESRSPFYIAYSVNKIICSKCEE